MPRSADRPVLRVQTIQFVHPKTTKSFATVRAAAGQSKLIHRERVVTKLRTRIVLNRFTRGEDDALLVKISQIRSSPLSR